MAEVRGRRQECAALRELVERVRRGESCAIVVRGEPGVGKTALLDYVAAEASDCRVAHAGGVQAEMELPFATLHQLLVPMLDQIGRASCRERV